VAQSRGDTQTTLEFAEKAAATRDRRWSFGINRSDTRSFSPQLHICILVLGKSSYLPFLLCSLRFLLLGESVALVATTGCTPRIYSNHGTLGCANSIYMVQDLCEVQNRVLTPFPPPKDLRTTRPSRWV